MALCNGHSQAGGDLKDGHQHYEEAIVIWDTGAQYGKVTDQRVRELFVQFEIFPLETPAFVIKEQGFHAIIISGGPNSVYTEDAPWFNPAIFTIGKPSFGICYGVQIMNKVFGCTMHKKSVREDGVFNIIVDNTCSLFGGLQKEEIVLLTHGDSVDKVAGGIKVVVHSGNTVAVCTALLNHALNQDQFIAVHIDNGFMRQRESQSVGEALKKLGIQVKVIRAAHSFYNGMTTLPISDEARNPGKRISKTLNMTTSSKEKRKITGNTFVKTANEVIGEMNLKPDEAFLTQGTLWADLIESASLVASGKAELIKTHHNDRE
ncbi:GMP synthase [glutamine-hydrolyzing] [Fukomys damarensis]|uniref:GMP synthase [glutamine-hydrolyzing] n=1 Tax=Fukomys damarensis TaxID=885580 RepID=A0A091E6G5_FUKDA|nr:GMP synthase [glutamine-hydrolyzing] [Fukomys damarensis]